MSIKKYRALYETIQQRSLTKAADVLGYSQPGISHMIRSLEEELGIVLLDRRKEGALPTAEAKKLLPYILQIIEAEHNIQKTAELFQQKTCLSIGCSYAVSVTWIPKLFELFEQKYRDIGLQLSVGRFEELGQWLRDGSIEMAVLSSPVPAEFTFKPLFEDTLMVMVREDHDLAGKQSVTAEELTKYPMILSFDEEEEKMVFGKKGLHANVKYRVKGDASAGELVSAGLGAAFIYKLCVPNMPASLKTVALSEKCSRVLGAAYRKDIHLSENAVKFCVLMEEYLQIER